MKKFYYDTILDRENICNLKAEQRSLRDAVLNKKKVIVYAPRNYGKTSLIQSVVIPDFTKEHKESFVLSVDLIEVKSEKDINRRVKRAFEIAFSKTYPHKSLFENLKDILKGLRPKIEFDPITSVPQVTLDFKENESGENWLEIFDVINTKIAKEFPVLITIDEFQDIAFVDGMQGQFRTAFESLKDIPLIILGSKQHILSEIFADPNSPLFHFGQDISFNPIDYEEYRAYMNDRFSQRSLSIGLEEAVYLQNLLHRIPEPINIVCSHLLDSLKPGKISKEDVNQALLSSVEKMKGRYQQFLSHFSEKEQSLLVKISKIGIVRQPTSKSFLANLDLSVQGVRGGIKRLMDQGLLELLIEEDGQKGYRLSDPLLELFLRWYR